MRLNYTYLFNKNKKAEKKKEWIVVKKKLKPLKIYIILNGLEEIHMKNAMIKFILSKYTGLFMYSNVMYARMMAL